MTDASTVLVLVPELLPAGGVQTFSRHLVAAVRDLLGDERTAVLSRNDRRGSLANELNRGGGNVRCVGLGNWPRRTRAAVARVAVARFARRIRAAAAVSAHPHLAAAAAGTGLPTLCVCHGVDVWSVGGPGWRNRRVVRGLLRTDRLLAVSRYTAARLREQVPGGLPPVDVFPNTIDTGRFAPTADETDGPLRSRLNLSEIGPILLTVARLATSEGPKGYDTVVRALPELARRFPNLRYVLAGKGPDADRVRALARSLGVADRLVLPGFVADADLPALYRAADLFVMPSRKEGFGIVFLEAMACGTPVVAGNADGSADAVCDGELGAMVDPGDPVALAGALAEALSDPPDPAEVRRKVVERFGTAAFRRRLAGHLADLVPGLAMSRGWR